MANVQIGYINIAESGLTTAIATDSDYPIYRLFDRYINRNWKSGSTGTLSETGATLVTNGGFDSATTGWSTTDDCSLSSVAGGQSGNALTINYTLGATGSNLLTNGGFDSVLTPWAVGDPSYTASIVSGGYSGNCVNINSSTTGTNLVSNGEFNTGTTGWTTTNGTITTVTPGNGGTGYACSLTKSTLDPNTNLLTNGSFESGTTGWTASGAVISIDTIHDSEGTQSLKCVFSPNTDYVYQDVSGLTIGNLYMFLADVAPVGTAYAGDWIELSVRTTLGVKIASSATKCSLVSYDFWSANVCLFVATATTHRFCLGLHSSETLGTFLFDDCRLYYRGTNLITNSDFETDLTGWTANDVVATREIYSTTYSLDYSVEVASGSETDHTKGIQQTITGLVVGHRYWVYASAVAGMSGSSTYFYVDTATPTDDAFHYLNYSGRWEYNFSEFTATSTTHTITLSGVYGTTVNYDAIFMFDVTEVFYGTSYSYMKQLVSLIPSTNYQFSCYYKDGTSTASDMSIIVQNGSDGTDYSSSDCITTSSWLSTTINFTTPSDETSMYIGITNKSDYTVYVDSFTLYAVTATSQQYIQQTVSGLTSSKYYQIGGYVKKPTSGDGSNYIIAAYRTDTSALISLQAGSSTTSWAVISNLIFQCPSDLTSVYIRLIRNEVTTGDVMFDSIGMYLYYHSPTSQTATQTITTLIGTDYRISAYVKDGIGSGALTTSPYKINVLDGATVIDYDSGNTSSSWTQKTIDFTATSTSTIIQLQKYSGTNGNIAFDTVTVYELITNYDDQWIMIDQEGGLIEVDYCIIPANHTLNGLTCYLQYSADGLSWTNAVSSWTQSGSSMITKSISPALTKRYWRFYTTGSTSSATLPSMGELYLTNLYQIVSQPKYDSINEGYKSNINRIEADSWKTRYLINGTHRKTYEYTLPYISSTEKTQLETIRDHLKGKKPFFIIDHQGNSLFVELTEDIIFTPIRSGYYNASLKFMESL